MENHHASTGLQEWVKARSQVATGTIDIVLTVMLTEVPRGRYLLG